MIRLFIMLLFFVIPGSVISKSASSYSIDYMEYSGANKIASTDFLQKTVIGDLPLKVLESSVESDLPMFVFISGDGGWNTFNESLCKYLAQKGIPVVAIDAQKYFWKSKSPEETAEDLITVIEEYQTKWKRDRFILSGYSFGATIVPFMVNRLPLNILSRLTFTVLISPDKSCDFEIHLSDMLNLGISKGKYDVIKEIQSGNYKRYIAVFGSDESRNVQQAFQLNEVKVEILDGNHHFDSGYEALADLIMVAINNSAK
jgi:type IV secretory pathway VirJ component